MATSRSYIGNMSTATPSLRLSTGAQQFHVANWKWGIGSVIIVKDIGSAEDSNWSNGVPSTAADLGYQRPLRLWPSGIVDGSGNMRIGWATIEANNTGYKVRLSSKK